MPLTEPEENRLVERFAQQLDKRRNVSESVHKQHHDFVQMLIDKEKRKQELHEKVKAQVAGWGIISVILAVVTGIGFWFRDWITKGP